MHCCYFIDASSNMGIYKTFRPQRLSSGNTLPSFTLHDLMLSVGLKYDCCRKQRLMLRGADVWLCCVLTDDVTIKEIARNCPPFKEGGESLGRLQERAWRQCWAPSSPVRMLTKYILILSSVCLGLSNDLFNSDFFLKFDIHFTSIPCRL
jgi:hypothetical protein